jgi:hypothetical protein
MRTNAIAKSSASSAPLHSAATAKEQTPATPVNPFSSVKLPADLVQQAKQAAQPLRRSVAGQIEYWATLGRVVEHSGLTVQEARTAIEGYEAASRQTFLANKANEAQADVLIERFLAVDADGSLAQRVRDVVADNRSRAHQKAA